MVIIFSMLAIAFLIIAQCSYVPEEPPETDYFACDYIRELHMSNLKKRAFLIISAIFALIATIWGILEWIS